MEEGRRWTAMRILAYCLMPNHWHMVLWLAGGLADPGESGYCCRGIESVAAAYSVRPAVWYRRMDGRGCEAVWGWYQPCAIAAAHQVNA